MAASNMLGIRSPGSGSSDTPQTLLEVGTHGVVGHVLIAGQLVGEGAHVTGALHVVLAAQRVHAHAFAAHVTGGHGQVGDAHDHGGALAVFGHPQAVVDGAVAVCGIGPGRFADQRPAGTPVTVSSASGELTARR